MATRQHMAIADEFAAALLELEGEIPQTFNWNSQDYPCFASRATKGGKLEHFGFGIDEDLVIIVRAGLFGDGGPFPVRGNTLTFLSVRYRIERVLTAPGTSFLRLACINDSRGT